VDPHDSESGARETGRGVSRAPSGGPLPNCYLGALADVSARLLIVSPLDVTGSF
jgi:hypothetical protein